MRSHEACCFYMIRIKVPDALVAMGCPPVDFIMSMAAVRGATAQMASHEARLLQAKVRSQEGFE